MADPKTCPDCHRPDCLTLEVIALDSVADCLSAQLAQRDERIAKLEAAGDALARDVRLIAPTLARKGYPRTSEEILLTHDAWTKARTA